MARWLGRAAGGREAPSVAQRSTGDRLTGPATAPISAERASARSARRSSSADFEHVADLSLTARRFLTALLRGLTLSLADEGKSGAKVLILDDRPL